MPRLNVYLPDKLHELAAKWRDSVNLSEICARALTEELEAAESGRVLGLLSRSLQPRSKLERALAEHCALADARIGAEGSNDLSLYDALGRVTADYIDTVLHDDTLFAVCGGRQMWSVVRNVSPRSLRVTFTALGFNQNDPSVLHAHPNTLVTLLWLLYSPRANAHLVGAPATASLWSAAAHARTGDAIQYLVVGSCSMFTAKSPIARLLPVSDIRELERKRVRSDFAYNFFRKDGSVIDFDPSVTHSFVSADALQRLSERSDTRVVLVAGGASKRPAIRHVLNNRLCNTLITDLKTAQLLLS